MIFLAKKDRLVAILFITIQVMCLILLGLIIDTVLVKGTTGILSIAIALLLLMLFLGWLWFGTLYRIDKGMLIYQSGPIKGRINVNTIKSITKNKTLLIGLKPALARGGIIIKYEQWNEVYIAPIDQEAMIGELLKTNPTIAVIGD